MSKAARRASSIWLITHLTPSSETRPSAQLCASNLARLLSGGGPDGTVAVPVRRYHACDRPLRCQPLQMTETIPRDTHFMKHPFILDLQLLGLNTNDLGNFEDCVALLEGIDSIPRKMLIVSEQILS